MKGTYDQEPLSGAMICCASTGQPSWEFTKSLVKLDDPAKEFCLQECAVEGLDWGRNKLLETFMESRCLYALMLSDQAVLMPGTLERLLTWNVPVVSALSVSHKPPYIPMSPRNFEGEGSYRGYFDEHNPHQLRDWIFAADEDGVASHIYLLKGQKAGPSATLLKPCPPDALHPVETGNAHCLLIAREVVAALEGEWFVPGVSFVEKATAAGFDCYEDWSIVAGHLSQYVAGLMDFVVWDSHTTYE